MELVCDIYSIVAAVFETAHKTYWHNIPIIFHLKIPYLLGWVLLLKMNNRMNNPTEVSRTKWEPLVLIWVNKVFQNLINHTEIFKKKQSHNLYNLLLIYYVLDKIPADSLDVLSLPVWSQNTDALRSVKVAQTFLFQGKWNSLFLIWEIFVRMPECTNQENSEYQHFLCSVYFLAFHFIF